MNVKRAFSLRALCAGGQRLKEGARAGERNDPAANDPMASAPGGRREVRGGEVGRDLRVYGSAKVSSRRPLRPGGRRGQ